MLPGPPWRLARRRMRRRRDFPSSAAFPCRARTGPLFLESAPANRAPQTGGGTLQEKTSKQLLTNTRDRPTVLGLSGSCASKCIYYPDCGMDDQHWRGKMPALSRQSLNSDGRSASARANNAADGQQDRQVCRPSRCPGSNASECEWGTVENDGDGLGGGRGRARLAPLPGEPAR